MKTKFLIEKNYNISVVAEGLDINEAILEFSLLLDDYKLSIPLKNIKENVFRLRLPSKIKNSISNAKNIEYCITATKDNLIFEVAKSNFELEYFSVKEVKIEESAEESIEESVEPVVQIEAVEEQVEDIKPVEKPKKKKRLNDDVNINSLDSKYKTLSYLIGRETD